MNRFLLALLAALTLTAVCTPCVCAYDIASEQAEAFGTAALESALPAQTYDAFGALSVADAAHPRPLLQKLWGYVLREGEGALASAARNAALLLAVGAAVVVALALAGVVKELLAFLGELGSASGVSADLFMPLYKTIGIALVVQVGGNLCRDAGESALASVVETAGTLCALLAALPLLRAVLDMLLELMG